MGTRNLTIVVSNGQTKVAQYGQWDGGLSGQGLDILKFLKSNSLEKFKKEIDKCSFLTEKEIDEMYKGIGIEGDFMNLEQSDRLEAKYPQLNRDVASKILFYINEGKIHKLQDSSDFAGDSLFCEWAYVVDLDKGTFEVYEGLNTNPLVESDRFYPLQADTKERKDKYYPVKLLASFDLKNLPSEDDFFEIEKEEESF